MKERDGKIILVVRIFMRYVYVQTLCSVSFTFVIFFQLSRKRDRQMPDVSRAGRNVCDKQIVRADGLATQAGTRDKLPSQGHLFAER